MALDASQLEALSYAELAFLAEDELVTIVPKQGLGALDFRGWKLDALRALRRSDVPLWLAVLLKRQDRCTLVYPHWLDVAYLKTMLDTEHVQPAFAALPYLWQPLSHIVTTEAGDDFQGNLDELNQLLQELREVRLTKVRQGVLNANDSHLRMDGLGAVELNCVRPVLARTMRTLQRVRDAPGETPGVGGSLGDPLGESLGESLGEPSSSLP